MTLPCINLLLATAWAKYYQGSNIQSPQARNYVAYIPVPINNDDDEEEDYDEEYEDEEYYDEDDEEYDEEYYYEDEDEVIICTQFKFK